jgi:hypothetical protein
MSAEETMYRVYVRMPRPDYKRPRVDECEFFHTDEKLARAVYRSLIRYELDGYVEWKNYHDEETELKKFEKDPEAYLDEFMCDYSDYLYGDSYMEEHPEFVFEEYEPPKCSTVLPDGAHGDPECEKLFAKYRQ